MKLLLLFTVPLVLSAVVERNNEPTVTQLSGVAYAIDFSQLATVQQLQCSVQRGYNSILVRGYSSAGQGTVDPNAVTNIQNSFTANIGVNVYMVPQQASSKSGYQQLGEMVSTLQSQGVSLRSVWLKITSPVDWSTSHSVNINFISDILSKAYLYNLSVGIFTNFYDWSQITGSWTGAGNVSLWYWDVYGTGNTGETTPDFTDFRPFGGWNNALMKQYAQSEYVCNILCNRNVFKTSTVSTGVELTKKI